MTIRQSFCRTKTNRSCFQSLEWKAENDYHNKRFCRQIIKINLTSTFSASFHELCFFIPNGALSLKFRHEGFVLDLQKKSVLSRLKIWHFLKETLSDRLAAHLSVSCVCSAFLTIRTYDAEKNNLCKSRLRQQEIVCNHPNVERKAFLQRILVLDVRRCECVSVNWLICLTFQFCFCLFIQIKAICLRGNFGCVCTAEIKDGTLTCKCYNNVVPGYIVISAALG